MRIQHNILAMNAYRNYNTNTSALAKNLEKLSSGYKINRAGDDAAGLAISEKMRAQITGLNAAQKNVKDGISLVKTAEGAMQEIQDMLNRMDYLATQSANGTYQDEVDRENLQKEVEALKTEINRIADSANFNGIKLLDGSLDDASSSTGVSKTDIKFLSSCDNNTVQLHKLGVASQDPSFEISLKEAFKGAVASATLAAGTKVQFKIKVGGQSITLKAVVASKVAKGGAIDVSKLTFASLTASTATFTPSGASSCKMKVTISGDKLTFAKASDQALVDFDCNMKVEFDLTGSKMKETAQNVTNCYTQNVKNGVAKKEDQLAHADFEFTSAMINSLEKGGSLHIGNVDITFDKDSQTVSGTAIGVKDLLDAKGNVKTDADTIKTLVTRVTQAANTNNVFTVGAGADGKTISLQEKAGFYNSATSADEDFLDTEDKIHAKVYLTGAAGGQAGALKLQIGDTAESYNQLSVKVGDMHVTAMKLNNVNISTQQGAQDAVSAIRDAINYVSGVRGDLGAVQNRLEHTANNLSVMAENIQDAESTIRDTDVAEEMMAYTKNNILIQSAQAMLAQANAVPQGVLQLLG